MQETTQQEAGRQDIRKLEVDLRMLSGDRKKIKAGPPEEGNGDGNQRLRDELKDARRMGADEILDRTLQVLGTGREDVKKLEIEVKYADGLEVEIELER